MTRKGVIKYGLLCFVLIICTLFFEMNGVSAVQVPKSRLPSGFKTGCGIYSAAQNDRVSKPPTGTTADPNFLNQSITGNPGGVVNVEILLLAETCVPSAAGYPNNTGHYINGVSVNNNATVISTPPNGIYYNTYGGNVNNIDVVRIPVSIRLPATLSSGDHVFTLSYGVRGRINRIGSAYQCVQSGGNRTGYNATSFYSGCFSGTRGLTFVVTVPPPPAGSIKTTKFGTPNTHNVCVNRDDGGNYGCSTSGIQTRNNIPGAGNTFNVTTTNTGTTKLVGWRLRFTDSGGTYHSCHVGIFPGAVDVNPNGFVSYCFKADVANAKFANIFVAPGKTTNIDLWYQSTVPLNTSGSCAVRISLVNGQTPASPVIINPGDKIIANFTVKNLGDPPGSGTGLFWNTVFRDPQNRIYRLATPGDAMTWGVNRVAIKEARTFGLAAGDTSIFEKEFTVPDSVSPGTNEFTWQLVREGDRRFGNLCSQTLQVSKKNQPYIMVKGGDVKSGASFKETGPTCVASDKAKDARISTSGYHGTTVQNSLRGTSMAQYGIFSSGAIGSSVPGSNTFRGNYGYRRDKLPTDTTEDIRDGLFATIDISGTNEYGYFYNREANPELPCIDISKDIADSTSTESGAGRANSFLQSNSSGTRTFEGDQFLTAKTLQSGTKQTIIVNGNVRVRGNITYPTVYNLTSVPYLKIIARGNIYIEANATQIDASLVAFPLQGPSFETTGIIDSCSNLQWDSIDPRIREGQWPVDLGGKMTARSDGSCWRPTGGLKINGAVAARRILLKRTNGTLGFKAEVADPSCYVSNFDEPLDGTVITDTTTGVKRHTDCAAEIVNFSPEAYIADFVRNNTQTVNVVPIHTQELPPIY